MLMQERSHADGVLVSGPRAQDLRIHDFLLVNGITSVGDYLSWLEESLVYRKDAPRDVWSAPEVVLRRGFGDCDDYAFLTAAVLDVMGLETRVICVDRGRSQHALCVFEDGGVFGWVDQTKLNRTDEVGWRKFARRLLGEYSAKRLLLMSRNPKSVRVLLT